MKTKLIIEIESPDRYNVWDNYDKSKEDYTKEQLDKFSKKFSEGVHNEIVKYIKHIEKKYE